MLLTDPVEACAADKGALHVMWQDMDMADGLEGFSPATQSTATSLRGLPLPESAQ